MCIYIYEVEFFLFLAYWATDWYVCILMNMHIGRWDGHITSNTVTTYCHIGHSSGWSPPVSRQPYGSCSVYTSLTQHRTQSCYNSSCRSSDTGLRNPRRTWIPWTRHRCGPGPPYPESSDISLKKLKRYATMSIDEILVCIL